MIHPLQIAAYVFGSFNALVCIGMFFVATRESGLSLAQRLTFSVVGISAVAYLSLRVALIVEGVH